MTYKGFLYIKGQQTLTAITKLSYISFAPVPYIQNEFKAKIKAKKRCYYSTTDYM